MDSAFANVRRVHATAQGWEVRRRLTNSIGRDTRHARKKTADGSSQFVL